MVFPFVNRKREITQLDTIYNQLGDRNQVVLLTGARGIGKSELVNHYISTNRLDHSIKVEVNQKQRDYEDGYYLRILGDYINKLSKTDSQFSSIESFVLGLKSKVLKERIFFAIKNDVKAILPAGNTIDEILDKLFKLEKYKADVFFNSSNFENFQLIQDYIKHQLKGGKYVIKIENFQSIDELSFGTLFELFSVLHGSLIILEYTENDDRAVHIESILDKTREHDLSCQLLPINAISIDEFKVIFHQYPEFTFKLLRESFVYRDGNLRPLTDYFIKLKYDLDFQRSLEHSAELIDHDQTRSHIESIAKSDLFILTLIYTHQSLLDKSLLFYIHDFRESLSILIDLETSIKNLEQRQLITEKNGLYRVAHDHIGNVLSKSDKSKTLILIANRFWLFVYEEKLSGSDLFVSLSERLLKILFFASILNDQTKILAYLNQIAAEALSSRSPLRLLSYVEDVKSQLSNGTLLNRKDQITNINFWLIELYQKLSMSKKALTILNETPEQSGRSKVLRGILYEQTGMQREALEIVKTELDELDDEASNYTLALRLIRLVCLYDIGQYKECRDEFEFIYTHDEYRNFFEFGFLLRNAELVYSFEESIPFYRESIAFFHSHNGKTQAAFSRIGLGVHLGLLGQLSEAEAEFRTADIELEGNITERHTLLNDIAVVRIYKGSRDTETKLLLKQALLSAQLDFDRVAIASNYLALSDWTGDSSEAEASIEIIKQILERPSFSTKAIIRYAYFNMMKYYQGRGETHNKEYYLGKIAELDLEVTPIWKYWLDGVPMSDDDEDFFTASIDRAVSYLTHWNMDYDSNLMRY